MGGTMMTQSRAEEWSDLAKNAASDDWQVAMQGHLKSTCKSFRKTAVSSRKVARASAVEAGYQPAAESVRTVKAAFATADPPGERHETGGFIQLLFDSFSQPRPPGTRSAAMRIRQMLYRADPFQIDIHIELEPEQNRLLITGQLIDLSHPEMVGRDVQVMLSDGREYLVNTTTNQFGEFLGEVRNSGDLEISFLGRSAKPIVILIRGPLDLSSGTSE
jgi:hypothetical protein